MFDLPLNEDEARLYLKEAAAFINSNPASRYLCVGHSYSFFGAAIAAFLPDSVGQIAFSATCGVGAVPLVRSTGKKTGHFYSLSDAREKYRTGILALRDKLRDAGYSPQEIVARKGLTLLLDYADSGHGLASMAEVLFGWADEEGVDTKQLAKKLVLCIQNDSLAPPVSAWHLHMPVTKSASEGARKKVIKLAVRRVLPASSGTGQPLIEPFFSTRYKKGPINYSHEWFLGDRCVPRQSVAALTDSAGDWDSAIRAMNSEEDRAALANMERVWPLVQARLALLGKQMGCAVDQSAPATPALTAPIRPADDDLKHPAAMRRRLG